ncbi:hypothetical protein HpBT230_14000 [Helicobacter pylori]
MIKNHAGYIQIHGVFEKKKMRDYGKKDPKDPHKGNEIKRR